MAIGTVAGYADLLRQLAAANAATRQSLKGINRKGLNVIKRQARANARALTSRGGNPVKATVRVRSGYVVGSVVPAKGFAHLRFAEYGTRSGWRWARKGGPFKFFAGNRLIVTRLIKHPGTAKRPWLEPAIEAAANEAVAAVGAALKAAVEKAQVTRDEG